MSPPFTDEEFDDEEFDDDENFDCGMCFDQNGRMLGCELAGTKQCDWDCPYREEFERIGDEESSEPKDG